MTEIAQGVRKHPQTKAPENARKVEIGNKVDVHCTGYLNTTPLQKFWSTRDSGNTFSFQVGVGQVIKGWDDACLSMREKEQARFAICADKAYGKSGFPAWGIPPNQDLVFDIEIVNIMK